MTDATSQFEDEAERAHQRREPRRVADVATLMLARESITGLSVLVAWLNVNLSLLAFSGQATLVGRGFGLFDGWGWLVAVLLLCAALQIIDSALLWVRHSRLRRVVTSRLRMWTHFATAIVYAAVIAVAQMSPGAGVSALPAVLLTNLVASLFCAVLDARLKNLLGRP